MNKRSAQPPKLAQSILKLYCGELRFEEINGDLDELFYSDLENLGHRNAKIKYWTNTIRCFKPYAWKGTKKRETSNMDLYINYLTTSWRRLKREKGYSAISLLALAIGLTSFILISTYIINEYSYEAFYQKSELTYRVVQVENDGHGVEHVAMSSVPLAKSIEEEIPAASTVVNVWRGAEGWIRNNEKEFYESKYILATEKFFVIFEQEFLYGSTESALRSPMSAVVTESFAKKYFEKLMVIGEVLDIDRYGQFIITAVVKDVPQNTHLPYDLILSPHFEEYLTKVHPFFRQYFDSWYGHPATTYILPENQNYIEDIEAGLSAILAKNAEEERPHNLHYLQKVSDIHFAENKVYSSVSRIAQGDKTKILSLSVIAVLLLLTSLINYINLFSARISRRLKEIGVRKCLGAAKS